jgi:ankyrin repeat protein
LQRLKRGTQTPLHNAGNQGREEVVKMLLEHGAAVDTSDVCSAGGGLIEPGILIRISYLGGMKLLPRVTSIRFKLTTFTSPLTPFDLGSK